MMMNTDDDSVVSRKICLLTMLAQTLGAHTLLYLPTGAVVAGALGNILMVVVLYIVVGIPLLYMETVVGQFTGRDCLEVWSIRACLSHLGYVQISWQIMFVIYNHVTNSFVVHYFLISFENPIPYYTCGNWSKSNCDILNFNYTVNMDCLKRRYPLPYCAELFETFPEYQYWRTHILALDDNRFHLPWRVGLGSGLISIYVCLSCFKSKKIMKRIFLFGTLYPVSARILFMIGSMLQKGIVVKYKDAIDSDFRQFNKDFNLSNMVATVLYSVNVGSGLAFGWASRSSFRAACYSNTVIVVVITTCVTIVGICSVVMMTCPYSFKYDISPLHMLHYAISNSFEKLPRLLHVYEQTSFWLIISYSYIAISSMTLGISIVYGFLDMMSKRYIKIERNSGLVAFLITVSLYIGTAPMLGNLILIYLIDAKNVFNVIVIYMVLLEIIVFVLWYGLERFSEDVHFMQGIQPNAFVKACWLCSAVLLVYVFFNEFYAAFLVRNKSTGHLIGWYLLLLHIVLPILVVIGRILIALYKNALHEEIRIDSSWGPRSLILQRSRAMFSAQAMTKEYMYRQYHLLAGILNRQKQSNVRVCYKLGHDLKPEGARFDPIEIC